MSGWCVEQQRRVFCSSGGVFRFSVTFWSVSGESFLGCALVVLLLCGFLVFGDQFRRFGEAPLCSCGWFSCSVVVTPHSLGVVVARGLGSWLCADAARWSEQEEKRDCRVSR